MERDGNLRRYYEFSRTTRYRIRKAIATGRPQETSSDDSDAERPPPRRERLQREIAAHHAGTPPASSSSSANDDYEDDDVEQVNNNQAVDNIANPDADLEDDLVANVADGGGDEQHIENNLNLSPEHSEASGSDHASNTASEDEESNHSFGNENDEEEMNEGEDEMNPEGEDEMNPEGEDEMNPEREDEMGDEAAGDEEYPWDRDDDDTLYEGAPLTVGESMMAILTFLMRYQLSGSCVSDLLSLINLHCKQEGNRCRKTLFQFRKFFENIQFPVKKHFYCLVCFRRLQNGARNCFECRQGAGRSCFIEIPILAQLRALYKRQGFVEKLQHRMTRQKQNENNYEDIYDGSIYKDLSRNGEILSDHSNISLTWYTDGVSIFKSSRYQIWPFYLVINELPYNQRTALPNAILAGLWFGTSQPVANLFLSAFRNDLLQLKTGIRVSLANNDVVRIRGVVMCGTCDLPAKSKFLNFKAFNSVHGCTKCKIETLYIRRGLRVYQYRQNLELRTDAETFVHAQEAVTLPLFRGDRQAVFGVKGPTVLSTFVHQCIRTTAIDVMHLGYLGLMKGQLRLWFSTKYKKENFSMVAYSRIVNERLHEICPPSFVKRLPRSLKDVKYWKAYELKMFLFYYSIAVFEDIMPEIYFSHHCLLVHALYLLCESSISEEMLVLASELLHEYVSQYENLYGVEHMTCNLHSLLHLPDVVRDFGPLWVTSCFPFEDINGKLKQLVNGTRYAELQICTSVSMLFKLRDLHAQLGRGHVAQFCEKLMDKHHRLNRTRIAPLMWIVGKYQKVHELPELVQGALELSHIQGTNFFKFYRLLKYNIIFGSQSYTRTTKTKSYCVSYVDGDSNSLGYVESYLRVTNCRCLELCECDAKFYAIIKKCITQNNVCSLPDTPMTFHHIFLGVEEQTLAVDVENLQSVNFIVGISDRNITYLIKPVNLREAE